MGTVKAGQVGLAAVALFTALLTMFYLMKVFSLVFLGEAKSPAPEKTRSMVFVVSLLAFLSLAAGILVSYPTKIVQAATTHILGMLK
jgi:NADH-quinone oxidoreductase subunit L